MEHTFRSTENIFQSKKNLVWFPGKCFPFWLCLFFLYLFAIRKVGQRKTLYSQRKIWLGFHGKFGRKTLSGSYEKFRNVIIC